MESTLGLCGNVGTIRKLHGFFLRTTWALLGNCLGITGAILGLLGDYEGSTWGLLGYSLVFFW